MEKKIYLDNSILNRPFDEQSNIKNRVERETLFLILKKIEQKELILVHSAIIAYENSLNPFPERKEFVEKVMKLATRYQDYTDEISIRASALKNEYNITSYDARHIASAEIAKIDFFITCDYQLVKKYTGDLKVITPIIFIKNYDEYPYATD